MTTLSRRQVVMLWFGFIVVMCAVAMYSLVGVMTGIYCYNSTQLGIDGFGDVYVIKRGDQWFSIHEDRIRLNMNASLLDPSRFQVEQGIWVTTVTITDPDSSIARPSTLSAHTPWNLTLVWHLTLGHYHDLGR